MLSKRAGPDVGFDSDDFWVDTVSDSEYKSTFGTNINQSALIKRNRMSAGSTRPNSLSMASNTVLSMYRVSDEYTQAQVDIGRDPTVTNMLLGDKSLYFRKSFNADRLSAEEVQKFEEEMDAYYVPFYFHDLRTNEMIAFHAFLETVSDGFTADYVEGEGMGRIGKTYSYKNTNRSINMSFHVVSTNSKDFDDMWVKINKLVSLLYPQYTQGREITNLENGHKFIQPFSQIVGSSPMIRLRVGDLIKNNFSELDLARLFGAGTKSFLISQEQQEINAQRNQDISSNLQEVKDFFNPEGELGNPVVQAFQSTKGEGLAGFIKSLKFDWTGATWETEQGSRAPKYMKIDIDFSPVHDISPGLSSDGMMIGAPYNIGNIMKAMKAKRSQSTNAYVNKEDLVLRATNSNNSETN